MAERRAAAGAAPFAPTQIPGLKLWLKADGTLWQDSARTTRALLDADPVGAWDDASGLGNHAAQATAVRRPTLKLAIQNGLAVIRCDGVDDFLTTATFALADPTHLFLLMQVRVWTLNLNVTDAVTGVRQLYMQTASPRLTMFKSANGPTILGCTVGVFHTLEALFNGASSLLCVDGGADATGNPGSSATAGLSLPAVAAAQATAVDFGEVLAYDSALSAANRAAVQGYLRARWGTP